MEGVGTNGADTLLVHVFGWALVVLILGHAGYAVWKLTRPICTIYLSGQMTGLPDNGRAEFAKYAKHYREAGYRVISPSEMDRHHPPKSYKGYIRRDINTMLRKADRVYMLPNWIYSKGAVCERVVAETVGIPIYEARTGHPIDGRPLAVWSIYKVPMELDDA